MLVVENGNLCQLLNVLERLRNGEREVFTVNTLFNSKVVLHESCVKLELFIYRVIRNYGEVHSKMRHTITIHSQHLILYRHVSVYDNIALLVHYVY
jgi:ABC-type polar amino acid transport system ATPase subunit